MRMMIDMKCLFSLMLILNLIALYGCSDSDVDAGNDAEAIVSPFDEGGGGGGKGNPFPNPVPIGDSISTDSSGGFGFDTISDPEGGGGNTDCLQDGQVCQDGNPCTANDYCESGTCLSGPFLCDDALQCTDDFCDANGNCTHELGLGWCLIDGGCYLNGESKGDDPCAVCTPQTSTSEWTVSGADGENSGPTCTNAFDLGDLSDAGSTVSAVGSVPDDHESDWYVFEGVDGPDTDGCDSYHVRARLLQNPGQAYAIDVRMGACPVENQVCQGAQDFEWYTDFMDGELGECQCTTIPEETSDTVHLCSNNSVRYYIRVYLKEGAVAGCAPYLLEVTNGVY